VNHQNASAHRRSEAGFTLIDTMVTVCVMGIVMAMAAPSLMDVSGHYRLGENVRHVERELQTARLRAVTSNRYIRVRFNCPVAGSYRMVEVIGRLSPPSTEDESPDRCKQSSYPYPAKDRNPMTRPNHDGPEQALHKSVSFGAASTLEFWPDGTVHKQAGSESPWQEVPTTGTAITLVKGTTVKKITVNGLGKIQVN
jgi:type II secretory pathway pseudopilin PulG